MELKGFSEIPEFRCEFTETVATYPKEEVDQAVCDVFDELRLSLLEKEKLHPSEECHRQIWKSSKSEIFDVINSYHVFCHLCNRHAYSRSVPTDINSFFQLHLNNEYHLEVRSAVPQSEEMIVWEKKWQTGRCNACQMSNILAFVIDQERNCSPWGLFREHYCHWDKDARENNQKFLAKMNLLRKYCKLSLFREKFIKPLNEGSVCLLCCSMIPWVGEKVKVHLGSQKHLYQFYCLVRNKFDLSPKELFNGFNLEMVTRWIYRCIFKFPKKYDDYEFVKQTCRISSRDPVGLVISSSPGHYCPAEIEQLLLYQPSDFTEGQHGMCLLCDKHCGLGLRHFSSEYHLDKSKNLSEKSFASSERYEAFYANLKNRLLEYSETIKKYNRLKEGKDVLSLKIGKVIDCKHTYVKNQVLKEIQIIEKSPLKFFEGNLFCGICNVLVGAPFVAKHTKGPGHLYNCDKWEDIKKLSKSKTFFEPFIRIRKLIVCLLCGISTKNFSHFFSHLKGNLHTKRFQEYQNLEEKVNISSAIDVAQDLSVGCFCCDTLLIGPYKFKKNLKELRKHWPCPPVRRNGKSIEEISKCRTCGNVAETHHADCSTNLLNFKNFEHSLKEMINRCEDVIFKRVLSKIKKKVRNNKAAITEDEKQQQEVEAMCECSNRESQCTCESVRDFFEGPKELDKNCEGINMSPLKNETLGDQADEEEELETLVISGFQRNKKMLNLITKNLTRFGEIRAKYYQGKSVVVAFAEKGIAEKVAACKNLLPIDMPPVEFKKSGSLSLPPDILHLLEDPSNLLDFVANQTVAATLAAESETELEREKSVCATINSAVLDAFPQCRCYPFGSRLSGLMSDNSDLDVFLDCGGMYEGVRNTTLSAEQLLIEKVKVLLRKKKEVSKLVTIARARVPIISFLHGPTGLRCDLSFKNALSVHKTLLIKFLVSLDYRAKFIIIFLKHWVKQNGIHGPPFFSSYAITMMAIFYLQQLKPPMMPTVEELQNAFVGRRLTIAGWDCSFSESAKNIVKEAGDYPFQIILQGFFSYYANFNYDKFVISPVNGRPIPREAFYANNQDKLPLCYKRNILNFPHPLEKLVCQDISLCIIDPFDLSHVLTKGFSAISLELFKHLCHLSAKALKRCVLRMLQP